MKKILLLLLLLLPLALSPAQARDRDDRDPYHDVLNKYHDLKDRYNNLANRRARLGSNRRIDYKFQQINDLREEIGYALEHRTESPKRLTKECDQLADLITDCANEYRNAVYVPPPRAPVHRRVIFGW